ncbi:MAG TPA: hypothetical protein VGA70_01540 [Longimicrobiales bacterium]
MPFATFDLPYDGVDCKTLDAAPARAFRLVERRIVAAHPPGGRARLRFDYFFGALFFPAMGLR